MTYIVYWILVETVMGSCPNVSKPNEFGYVSSSYTVCAAMHWDKVRTEKQRRFHNKDSAFQFYSKAMKKAKGVKVATRNLDGSLSGDSIISFGGDYEIEKVRIDSLKR